MGYRITLENSAFGIKAENVAAAHQAVIALMDEVAEKGTAHTFSSSTTLVYYAWVDTLTVQESESFEAAMEEWRWPISYDRAGNVTKIKFSGENAGDDFHLFKALAPFVKAGSFIEILGEDGDRWRWVFDGKTCRQIDPEVVWPS